MENEIIDGARKSEIIREYMRAMALRSVEKQKFNPTKMSEMGKASGIIRRGRRDKRLREELERQGEAVDVVLK